MSSPTLRPAPYLSLRHARAGRVGEQGRLPAGWEGEHVAAIEVLELGFVEGKPFATVRLDARASSSPWSSLTLAPYLATADRTVVALVGQVSFLDWSGVDEAMFALREWRAGGELVRQSSRTLQLAPNPQVSAVALESGGDDRVVQPLLAFRRTENDSASMAVSLAGLAFGALEDNPRWLWA